MKQILLAVLFANILTSAIAQNERYTGAMQKNMQAMAEAKTADAMWLTHLEILAPDVNQEVIAKATLVPYNTATTELFTERKVEVVIHDILGKATTDQQTGMVVMGLFAEIEKYAKQMGAI